MCLRGPRMFSWLSFHSDITAAVGTVWNVVGLQVTEIVVNIICQSLKCYRTSCALRLAFNLMPVTNASHICVMESAVLSKLTFWLSTQHLSVSNCNEMTSLLQPGGRRWPDLTLLCFFSQWSLTILQQSYFTTLNSLSFQTLCQSLFYFFLF